MSRQYADHITVRCAAPTGGAEQDAPPPEQFVWRRRRYRVLEVVQRWVEVGFWWRAARAADEEYDMWRVEAAAERRRGHVGQYDLCRHRGTDRWFLVRAFD